jgi:hypothetical protein
MLGQAVVGEVVAEFKDLDNTTITNKLVNSKMCAVREAGKY